MSRRRFSRLNLAVEQGQEIVRQWVVEIVGDHYLSPQRTELPWLALLFQSHEFGHRLAGPGDNDVLALLDALKQPRQMGLRFVNVYLHG